MGKIDDLFTYIPYFENSSVEDVCQWGGGEQRDDGVITMPYPIYDKRLTDFIQAVYGTDLMDKNYTGTLEKHNLPMSDHLADFIDEANIDLVKAILTCYVRQERFCDGLWATAIKDKVFYKILMRLKHLL